MPKPPDGDGGYEMPKPPDGDDGRPSMPDENPQQFAKCAKEGPHDGCENGPAIPKEKSMGAYVAYCDNHEVYKTATELKEEELKGDWGPRRKRLDAVISTPRFEICISFIVLFNMVVMAIDANAGTKTYPLPHQLHYLIWINRVILMIYTIEALLRIFVLRSDFIRDRWGILDLAIVVSGWLDELYQVIMSVSSEAVPVPIVNILPMMRILRLLRLVKILRVVPELRTMVMGFFGAARAMLWGFLLILVLIFFWSMVFLELIFPVMVKLLEDDPDALTPFCQLAFSSATHAAWMLFQTLVAGDSWGTCTMPVVEFEQWTFFVFALAVVSVTLGMMNLILSVIVDKAAHARDGDKEERLKHKKEAERESLIAWGNVIEQIDLDGDQKISMDEIMKGYDVPIVRDNMNLLGISKGDLDDMFYLMDKDGSGDLDYKEFLGMFHKAQGQDLRIYLMTMHLQSQRINHSVELLRQDVSDIKAQVAETTRGQGKPEPDLDPKDPHKMTM